MVRVSPNAIKAWRESEVVSEAKDDPGNAEVIAEYRPEQLPRGPPALRRYPLLEHHGVHALIHRHPQLHHHTHLGHEAHLPFVQVRVGLRALFVGSAEARAAVRGTLGYRHQLSSADR